MRVRHWLLSTVALALALVLSGCTEEPKPIFPDPTTPTPGASASSSEPAPEPESAEDFIRRWTAEALDAQTSGDTKQYRRLTRPCKSCRSFADQVDTIYRDGGHVSVARLEVVSVKRQAKGVDEFLVIRRSSETKVFDSSGAVQQSFSGGRESISVFLTKDDDGNWLVRETLSN